jgi:hypothetical protein
LEEAASAAGANLGRAGSGKGKNCSIALGYKGLRVKNAGCNEDFAVEPAEF